MSKTRQIDIPVIKKHQTDATPFKFVIYGLEGNNIIVEHPNSGECYYVNKSEIGSYIHTAEKTTPWIDDANGQKIRFNQDNIEQSCKVTDTIERYTFTIHVGPAYNVLFEKRDQLDTFKFIDKNRIQVDLPLYPSTLVCAKDDSRKTLNLLQFMMEHNGEYYKFPYGNVFSGFGEMCLGSIPNSSNATELFWRIISSESNFDLGFRIKCVKSNIDTPNNFDFDDISQKIDNYQPIDLFEAFYYLSKADFNQIDPEKIFKKIFPLWETTR